MIAFSLFLAACSSDDNNNAYVPPVGTPSNDTYVTGKVEGADFSSIIFGVSAANCQKIGSGDDQIVTILGSDMAANSITISLYGPITARDYTVNAGTNSFLNYSPGSGGVAFATTADCTGASGTITVTHVDDSKVEGTFSFTGVDTEDCAGGSKTITQGTFRGTYQ
ncbi:hypothetical protein SAMN02927903_02555 [Flavobacterium caeni]|uniref:Uncharacterized protein n=1 Tax=Flavobacterium caeni TaxID=490189 RepID=A0A1G5J5F7_9FLAO|nr:hypothetical protein SAMN02927903_02555 [Flavobacterium caeni]